ncbi:MAG TPA: hypothetical protein VMW80_11280 [Candidatus Dormibacteraeota bacterium]|nr:hypothetical protein [Candidatus Dormibacteraeota bacterium]
MRIAGESLGARGAAALSATAVVAALLAIHGFAHPGTLALSGTTGSGLRHSTTPTASPYAQASPSATSKPTPASTKAPGPLLSSTSYGAYAYQLYPGAPSASAKLALAGFSYTATPSGSSVRFTLSVVGGGQPPQTKAYPSTDHIYFIEASLGDDSGSSEYNFSDDGVVVTDASGHVVS